MDSALYKSTVPCYVCQCVYHSIGPYRPIKPGTILITIPISSLVGITNNLISSWNLGTPEFISLGTESLVTGSRAVDHDCLYSVGVHLR